MDATQFKPLSTKRAADIVQQFADKGSEWWLSPASLLESNAYYQHPRQVDIVVTGPDGKELGRWPLMPITYGSLVRRHVKNPVGEFALPHARGYQYDDYEQLAEVKRQAGKLIEEVAPSVNALLERKYFVDDTAGINLAAADAWLNQAEEIVKQSCFWRLQELYGQVGAPNYWQHSSQLAEILPQAREGYQQLRNFLTTTPPPIPSNESGIKVTSGDGSRYQGRSYVGLYAGDGGSYFTSKFQGNRINEWHNIAPFDNEWPKEIDPIQPTTLRKKLLEIQRLIGEVLRELE